MIKSMKVKRNMPNVSDNKMLALIKVFTLGVSISYHTYILTNLRTIRRWLRVLGVLEEEKPFLIKRYSNQPAERRGFSYKCREKMVISSFKQDMVTKRFNLISDYMDLFVAYLDKLGVIAMIILYVMSKVNPKLYTLVRLISASQQLQVPTSETGNFHIRKENV